MSQPAIMTTEQPELVQRADFYRVDANLKLNNKTRSKMGQFMTPSAVAEFMASLFLKRRSKKITLLDPGAGVGSLTSAFIGNIQRWDESPRRIHVDAYELEPVMHEYLDLTLAECRSACAKSGVDFSDRLFKDDFIKRGVEMLQNEASLFCTEKAPRYSHCIMNPPYKKIRSDSDHRKLLRRIGVETGNLYSAFLAVAIKMLDDGGELVAIVPRSFCNGPYFLPFRKLLLHQMALRHIHVFDSRTKAFKDDDVLQENIIFYAVKNRKPNRVIITSCDDPSFSGMTYREVPFDKVIKPGDPDKFIHIAVSELEQNILDRMSVFTKSLAHLHLELSTGPVVDFRLRSDIVQEPRADARPLIYPIHFTDNYVKWPKNNSKKPNAIFATGRSNRWLMPNGWYTVTKRFTSKEERRRIVAAVHDPRRVPGEQIGFENHLNVFHYQKSGLDPLIAKGLALYLNSTLFDLLFRQFSGHTQVNATDLRMMRYPSSKTLIALGKMVGDIFPSQEDVDELLNKEINKMTEHNSLDPLLIKKKIEEALSILKKFGLPKGQQNERSALTLLALLDLKPDGSWSAVDEPLMGITRIMDFCRDYYGKNYAPNTRETFRRQTMHQFVDAGIATPNPDKPDRPINSPKWVYQIEQNTLTLVRSFGSPEWEEKLPAYLGLRDTLAEQYAKEREMQMIPLTINGLDEITLSPGAHSLLIKEIIENFGPRFTPGSQVLYVGDTGSKMGLFDKKKFKELDLTFDSHGKFPDVVLYHPEKNWLILVESVTSHGPVDSKRHNELSKLFSEGKAGLVFVTAFPNRQLMAKYLAEISWETEVWVADAPTHLIHFNGERFLGPYEEQIPLEI